MTNQDEANRIAEAVAGKLQLALGDAATVVAGVLLSRAMIEQASELRTEIVSVPEWGGSVMIRELTGEERDEYEAGIIGDRGGRDRRINLRNIRAKLVGLCLIDPETNQRMYSDREIGILGRKSARALSRVSEACQRLAGITEEDVDELEAAMTTNPNESSGSR
jgi:hypothetical protein